MMNETSFLFFDQILECLSHFNITRLTLDFDRKLLKSVALCHILELRCYVDSTELCVFIKSRNEQITYLDTDHHDRVNRFLFSSP